jgi:hypothetical protein
MRNRKAYLILLGIVLAISFGLRFAQINSPQYVDEQAYDRLAQ